MEEISEMKNSTIIRSGKFTAPDGTIRDYTPRMARLHNATQNLVYALQDGVLENPKELSTEEQNAFVNELVWLRSCLNLVAEHPASRTGIFRWTINGGGR
jgi:hypothetical protein